MHRATSQGNRDGNAALSTPTSNDTTRKSSLSQSSRSTPPRIAVKSEIRDLIARRVLKPGQHIGEHALARRLGTSRHPVREALQGLAHEGWVRLEAERGAFVHQPSDKEVQDAFRVRAALESEGVRAGAARATENDIEELRALIAAGRESLLSDNVDALVKANARFHRSVALLSENRLLADLLETLDSRIRWYFSQVALTRGTHSWNEHDAIVDAISNGDADRAAMLMREHSHNTEVAYLRAQHQD